MGKPEKLAAKSTPEWIEKRNAIDMELWSVASAIRGVASLTYPELDISTEGKANIACLFEMLADRIKQIEEKL